MEWASDRDREAVELKASEKRLLQELTEAYTQLDEQQLKHDEYICQ